MFLPSASLAGSLPWRARHQTVSSLRARAPGGEHIPSPHASHTLGLCLAHSQKHAWMVHACEYRRQLASVGQPYGAAHQDCARSPHKQLIVCQTNGSPAMRPAQRPDSDRLTPPRCKLPSGSQPLDDRPRRLSFPLTCHLTPNCAGHTGVGPHVARAGARGAPMLEVADGICIVEIAELEAGRARRKACLDEALAPQWALGARIPTSPGGVGWWWSPPPPRTRASY